MPRSDDAELSQNPGALFVRDALGQQSLECVPRCRPIAEPREDLNRALSNCSILGLQTAEACDRLLSRLKVGQRPHLQVEEPIQEGAKTRDLAHPASPPLKQRGPITELPRSGVEPLQVPARFVCVRVTSDSLKPTGDRARLVSGDVRKVKASSRQAL
jgi:hypothetical protein